MTRPITSLGEASLFNSQRLFRTVTVAVAAEDRAAAKLVKKVLAPLGCATVHIVHDAIATLSLLKRVAIDILIMDRDLGTCGGLETVRLLRQAHDSPGRTVPIIYLSPQVSPAEIQDALQAGITEFVAKPFSARSLLGAVHAVVEQPRAFIMSPGYIGPDRRGIVSGLNPGDRAVLDERLPPKIVPPVQLRKKEPIDEPCMVLPDYSLKHRLGLDRSHERDLITESIIIRSEEALEVARSRFIDDLQTSISSLLHMNRMMIQHASRRTRLIDTLKSLTGSIERQTRQLGYLKATEVARLLMVYCHQHAADTSNLNVLILEKHALTLSAVLSSIRRLGNESAAHDLLRDLHDQIGMLGSEPH